MRSYRDNIVRILYAYPPGTEGLVPALEAICRTAEENGAREASGKLAETVCEGLHTSPPRGLKCRSCYNAEQNMMETEKVLSEIEIANRQKDETS